MSTEMTEFTDLFKALLHARKTLEVAETDALVDAVGSLFDAVAPLTPAELDQLVGLLVARCRMEKAPVAEYVRPPREWIRIDDGTAVYADARPGGTHVWDKDGHEWVCMSRRNARYWEDPRDVYKVHGPVDAEVPAPQTWTGQGRGFAM